MTAKKPAKKAAKKSAGRTTPKKDDGEVVPEAMDELRGLFGLGLAAEPPKIPSFEPPKWGASGEAIIKRKKVLSDSVTICLDPELHWAQLEAGKLLEKAYQHLSLRPNNKKAQATFDEAMAEYTKAAEAAAAESVKFTAKALPRPEWEDIIGDERNIPTDEQKADWKRKLKAEDKQMVPLTYNPDWLPPTMMVHCLTEPDLTWDEAVHIWTTWSDAETGVIVDLCRRLQKIVV